MSEQEFNYEFRESIQQGFLDQAKHYDYIAAKLNHWHTIIFTWSPDEINSYILSFSISPKVLTRMSFGGQLGGNSIQVGVRYRGFNFFTIEQCAEGLHPDYVQEKLGCSGQVSLLLKEVCKRLLDK
jgi:hypothetical protein